MAQLRRVLRWVLLSAVLAAASTALIVPESRGWVVTAAWPWLLERVWPLVRAGFDSLSNNAPVILFPITIVFFAFVKLYVEIVTTHEVNPRDIRLRAFGSIAFGVFVSLCAPLAILAFYALKGGSFHWAINMLIASITGLFGTVDLAAAKLTGLREVVDRLMLSIAADIGADISLRNAARSAVTASRLATRRDSEELENDLLLLGVTEASIQAIKAPFVSAPKKVRTALAIEIVRKNPQYAAILTGGSLFT